MKGNELAVETLIDNGTKYTFGITGGSIIPVFDAFYDRQDRIKNIVVRHEQAAAHAADAFARVSGKQGVCITTTGPGTANIVSGIYTAYMDSSPVVALGGQVATHLIGNDAFQEADMIGMMLPITKHNYQIRKTDAIEPTIRKAYKLSMEGRPGPVYVDFPVDIQKQEAGELLRQPVKIPTYNPSTKPHSEQVKKAVEMIFAAQKPVLLIGGGAVLSNAGDELFKLVELLKIPVITTMMGKSIFPENHPLSLGMLGMHGRKIANYAIMHCDLIINIGCRFSDRITGSLKHFASEAKVIHIDIDPAEIGKNVPVTLPIVADAREAIKAIYYESVKQANKRKDTEWKDRIVKLGEACDSCYSSDSPTINPRDVMFALNKMIKEDDIITTGVGQHQMFAAHFLRRLRPRTFISSRGAGTMGFGLPAAMGAKLAAPNKRVIDIDGDGSFQMNIQELSTLKAENINVTPIILNNNYLGMVRQWQELFFQKRYSQVNINSPNYAKLADAYGHESVTIERKSELKELLSQAINAEGTTLVDIHIEPESNILPMIPAGGQLKQMFGPCIKGPGEFF